MKSESPRYLLIGLALFTLVLAAACVKPASTPTPAAEFEISSLIITPHEATVGQLVTVAVDVENVGDSEAAHSITLIIDGTKAETKVIKIPPRAVEKVSFTIVRDEPKIYQVQIDGLSGTFQLLKPAEFTVSNLAINPVSINAGETATATADVNNTGDVESSCLVRLLIDGVQVETKEIVMAPGTTQAVTFTLTKDAAGLYEVEINELKGILKVWLAGQTPLDIHKESWLNMLSKAETDSYYSYAIYASRILAVKHPEFYLQGDDIFTQVITATAGMKQAYETKNVHSEYFMKLQLGGDCFSFDDVDFGKYELIASKEVYPPDYPFLGSVAYQCHTIPPTFLTSSIQFLTGTLI